MKCSTRCLLATFWIGVIVTAPLRAEEANWPQFRGPQGNGVSTAVHVPWVWSKTENIRWKVSLPGRGRSSPVVMQDRIWLTTALEKGVRRTRIGPDDMQVAERVELGVVCVQGTDGKVLWHVTLFEVDKPAPVHWLNSWATPTPVVEPGRLYADFGAFGTACLESQNGQVVWKQRLPVDHQVGPGSSPMLLQDRLILVRDGRDAQFVAALDKITGQKLWQAERPPLNTSMGDLKKSFSTPLITKIGEQTQIISSGAHWIVAYEPASGREIWRLRHGEGFSIGSCPVYGRGIVYFSTGFGRAQLLAVRADGQGDVTTTHLVWKSTRQVPAISSPLLAGEEIYWVSDEGIACATDARSGKSLWQERLGGSHLASPIYAEGRLYFFSQDGKTTVIKAGRTFERLAENQLEGPLVASPAVVDHAIFLRTDHHLYRIGAKDRP